MFTTTQVGSWPRSRKLLQALRMRQKGQMARQQFEQIADEEVRRCVQHQLEAGMDIIVDGEQRRDNFYSFITDKVDGTKLMSLAEMLDTIEDKSSFEEMLTTLDVSASSIKNPTCVGKLARREPLALNEYRWKRSNKSCASRIFCAITTTDESTGAWRAFSPRAGAQRSRLIRFLSALARLALAAPALLGPA